jgi:hypothetical protein
MVFIIQSLLNQFKRLNHLFTTGDPSSGVKFLILLQKRNKELIGIWDAGLWTTFRIFA